MERTSARKYSDIRGRVNSFYAGRESCQAGERRVCRKRYFFAGRNASLSGCHASAPFRLRGRWLHRLALSAANVLQFTLSFEGPVFPFWITACPAGCTARTEQGFRVALACTERSECAPAKSCSYSWQLLADQPAAAAGEDGRSAGETCAPLLAFAGRRTSESEAVRQHAEKDRGVAAVGRLANQDGKQTSARKPSSREVSAGRQTGAGKTSRAAPQNGRDDPYYQPKGASATWG